MNFPRLFFFGCCMIPVVASTGLVQARDFNVRDTSELVTALQDANADPGQDRIFLSSGTYDLTASWEAGERSALNISGNLILQGEDAADTVITAGGRGYRVINVQPDVEVTIREITISNGVAEGSGADTGGGIQNLGILTLDNVTLSGNEATFGGGIASISNADTLIINSRIMGNHAQNRTDTEPPGTPQGRGGGVALFGGTVTLRDTLIETNSASRGGGGIYNDGDLTLRRVTVTGNRTTRIDCVAGFFTGVVKDRGGGIDNLRDLEIHDSEVLNNESGCGGGLANHGRESHLVANNVLVRSNKARFGGGVYNAGRLEMARSRIWQNESNGIFVEGDESDTIVSTSEIRGNSNTAIRNQGNLTMRAVGVNNNLGTAIVNDYGGSSMRVTESAIFGNSFQGSLSDRIWQLHAVENHGELDLTNVTVAFNSGGILNDDFGRARLTNVTITGNTGYQLQHSARVDVNGQTRLKNTIIARPLANGINCWIGSGLNGRPAFFSDGFNLSDDDTCGFDQMGDLNGVDALITGQMRLDNPPRTYYNLLADSPAVDVIPVDECVTVMGLRVSNDQRDNPRPQGGGCDIGAVER